MDVEIFNGSSVNDRSFNGHSMTGELLRVMVCPPENAGWDRLAESRSVARAWVSACTGFCGGADAARDSVPVTARERSRGGESSRGGIAYARCGLCSRCVAGHGLWSGRDESGKEESRGGGAGARCVLRALGIPLLGEIKLPGTAESGDIVWLDSRTLLVGNGYRTNQAGIEQMRALLSRQGC